jgi:hypothetical protein
MRKSILFAILSFAAAANAEISWPLTGTFTQECAVAVAVHPALYAAATRGRFNALWSELRVRDSKGRDVPYSFRAQKRRFNEVVKEWQKLRIVRLTESDGRLVVEAEYPLIADTPHPGRFLALRVSTPLTDFEQSVEVSADGVPLASGVLFDYRKFADLRVTEMPFDISYRRKITITFANPTSESASAAVERTIRENAHGKLEAKTLRDSVVKRPFRIDAISVLVPCGMCSTFRPVMPVEIKTPSKVVTDEKRQKTVIETRAFGMPVTALVLNVQDRNFSRRVSVFRRIDGRWHPFASGKIRAVNLPGEKVRYEEVSFERVLTEEIYRIEIENLDNPPLELAEVPVALKVTPFDVVFIASPDEKYSIAVVNGAERQRYDDNLIDYIDRVRDPVRFNIDIPNDWKDLQCRDFDNSIPFLSPRNLILLISILVFAALGFICIRLIKATS